MSEDGGFEYGSLLDEGDGGSVNNPIIHAESILSTRFNYIITLKLNINQPRFLDGL